MKTIFAMLALFSVIGTTFTLPTGPTQNVTATFHELGVNQAVPLPIAEYGSNSNRNIQDRQRRFIGGAVIAGPDGIAAIGVRGGFIPG